MKITENYVFEVFLTELYIASKNDIDANERIKTILKVFKVISIFTEENHEEIVRRIYFENSNIVRLGVRISAEKVFVQEKTLYNYRRKYCKAIKEILSLFE